MGTEKSELQLLRTRVHNLEKMYDTQVLANKRLKEENRLLKEENERLKFENKELRAKVEKLELIVEELRGMVFKKVKKKKETDASDPKEKSEKKQREKSSYRRKKPDETEVTDTVQFTVSSCSQCWWVFASKKELIRYIEDMVLPSDGTFPNKLVHKESIEKGYCEHCDKRTRAKDITSQECTIWNGVRAFVVYGVTELKFSFEQIKSYMMTMVNIFLSDWEIANILKSESNKLLSEYESMKKRIRKKDVIHFDETVWNVQSVKEKWYGRIMSWKDGIERVYSLWCTRWSVNLDALKWNSKAIWVSDDYWAYKHSFKKHQLCRAHPIRKMRDLVESWKLSTLQIGICKVAYDALRQLHKEILESLEKQVYLDENVQEILSVKFQDITQTVAWEPEKLLNIRKSLLKNKDKYFTCIRNPWVPTTNNVAERWLRPLVIKRKLSFWSKTQDWAQAMERLYSVVFSITAKHKNNFFDHYLKVRS